eukprot:Skav236585  [mRNA]  locus=scaffold529:95458:96437:- [translate_table: standard]
MPRESFSWEEIEKRCEQIRTAKKRQEFTLWEMPKKSCKEMPRERDLMPGWLRAHLGVAAMQLVELCMLLSGDVMTQLAVSNDAKREMTLRRDVVRQLTLSNDVKREMKMRRDVMTQLILSNDVERKVTLRRGVVTQLTLTLSNDVKRETKMRRDVMKQLTLN